MSFVCKKVKGKAFTLKLKRCAEIDVNKRMAIFHSESCKQIVEKVGVSKCKLRDFTVFIFGWIIDSLNRLLEKHF